jgi:hypothetical protein
MKALDRKLLVVAAVMATCMLTPALIALGIVRLAKQANIDFGLRWHLRPAIITLMQVESGRLGSVLTKQLQILHTAEYAKYGK